MHILPLLTQALLAQGAERTAISLGDRSTYIGMSDIGRAIDCQRAAVANKLKSPHDHDYNALHPGNTPDVLTRELRLQRGHWFEQGVRDALASFHAAFLHQVAIHTKHHGVPIIAHLDFVFPVPEHVGSKAYIQAVEFKSAENIPDTAYASHEIQLAGQLGLLQKQWDKPCFSLGHADEGTLYTFPELVRNTLGYQLPASSADANIEGGILTVSMNEIRQFEPYQPNDIMMGLCLNLAALVWRQMEAVREGFMSLDSVPTAEGFNPLCNWCEWNKDCPRFAGANAPGLEGEIDYLQQMKEQKELLCSRIGELEEQLKLFCRAQPDPHAWISAETVRIRLSQCAGRRTLDKDLLYAALSRLLDEDTAQAVLEAGYKETKAFERLLVGTIN